MCLPLACYADGLLPGLNEVMGVVMPIMGNAIGRECSNETQNEEGETIQTYINVSENEYDLFGIYLGEKGWSIKDYQVDGNIIGVIIENDSSTFSFDYDVSTETVHVVYPRYAECERLYTYKKNEIIEFGKYEQDGNLGNGPEPIEWLVIESNENGCTLLSKKILESKLYHNDKVDRLNWEMCSLRQWLNNEFYNAAFSKKEKESIILTTVENNDSIDGLDNGKNTKDYVYILSFDEILRYFGNDLKLEWWKKRELHYWDPNCDLAAWPTDYMLAKHNPYVLSSETRYHYDRYFSGEEEYKVFEGAGRWYLRTVTAWLTGHETRYVNYIDFLGNGGTSEAVDGCLNELGIRPVIQVSFTAEEKSFSQTASASNQAVDKQSNSSSRYELLKPGSKGQMVLDVRMKLYELGYFKNKPTQVEYTKNMMAYVKKFEKDNGLKQDGILSPEDQEVLFGL